MSVLVGYAQDSATPKLIVAARLYLGLLCLMLCIPILNKMFLLAVLSKLTTYEPCSQNSYLLFTCNYLTKTSILSLAIVKNLANK